MVQCATASQAQYFSTPGCNLAPDSCYCSTSEGSLTCQCSSTNIGVLFEKGERLPYILSNGILRMESRSPTLELSPRQKLKLSASIKNGLLVANKPRSSCTGEFRRLEGCYECESGAILTYMCSSTPGHLDALVECDDGSKFIISCVNGPSAERVVRFNAQRRNIKTTCVVRCPEGGFTGYLNALLDYSPLLNARESDLVTVTFTGAGDWNWGELFSLQWLRALSWFTMAGVILGCVVVLYVAFRGKYKVKRR